MGAGAPSYGAAAAPDPNGLGASVSRLSSSARRSGKTALLAAAVLLDEREIVECAAVGRMEAEPAVVVLTDRRVLLVNERTWSPSVVNLPVDSSLAVQGWQDSRTATLTFVVGGRQHVVEQITDKQLAVEVAGRVRARNGSA